VVVWGRGRGGAHLSPSSSERQAPRPVPSRKLAQAVLSARTPIYRYRKLVGHLGVYHLRIVSCLGTGIESKCKCKKQEAQVAPQGGGAGAGAGVGAGHRELREGRHRA
jgi:hypothetical protein